MILVSGSVQGLGQVISGPMVGYSSMKEVAVWVQTDGEAEVYMTYINRGDDAETGRSNTVTTNKQQAYTARLTAEDLKPGQVYDYKIVVNGNAVTSNNEQKFQTQILWQWRTDPPDFSFAIGSCFYVNEAPYDRPGKPYGGEYNILASVYKDSPDFMLWLGDNTYLREADWTSRSGYIHRYSHTRGLKELQPLLANTHHYATWDDHDFGPNDSDRSWAKKEIALEMFDLFWANPHFSGYQDSGVSNYFQWADCDFFLMDDRWHKSPNRLSNGVWGRKQLDWLKESLIGSKAKYKFIANGVMVLSGAAEKENMANAAADERQELIDYINEYKITGVVFLTGDRHFSELSMIDEEGGVPIYDITSSPLTSGVASSAFQDEQNPNRVDGTAVFQRNYGLLTVSGPRSDRRLTLTLKSVAGETIWSKTIKQLVTH